jgi:hypothetical protein
MPTAADYGRQHEHFVGDAITFVEVADGRKLVLDTKIATHNFLSRRDLLNIVDIAGKNPEKVAVFVDAPTIFLSQHQQTMLLCLVEGHEVVAKLTVTSDNPPHPFED